MSEKEIPSMETRRKEVKLPNEIEVDILQRLPVKSLLRFRAVCKPWCSLTFDPNFVEMHLRRTMKGDNINHWRLCNEDYDRDSRSVSLYLMEIKSSSDRKVKQISNVKQFFSQDHHVSNAKLLCSCNGLILLQLDYDENLILFNPSTREYKKFSSGYFQNHCEGYMIWGLAYDSSTKDYKVVGANHYTSGPESPRHGYCYQATYVFFFDFKTDSWTEIEHNDFPYDILSSGQGTVVNGAPHWVVTRRITDYSLYILSKFRSKVIIYFDVKEDKFKEISSPAWLDQNLSFDIGVLGGCLCMAQKQQGGSCFEITAMEEYGVQESWTKLFVIPHFLDCKNLMPLCFKQNIGEVLIKVYRKVDLLRKREFVIYNLKQNVYTVILSEDIDSGNFKTVMYVESLVSPNVRQ